MAEIAGVRQCDIRQICPRRGTPPCVPFGKFISGQLVLMVSVRVISDGRAVRKI